MTVYVVLLPPVAQAAGRSWEDARNLSNDAEAYVVAGRARLAGATRATWAKLWRVLPRDAPVVVDLHDDQDSNQVRVLCAPDAAERGGAWFGSAYELRGAVEQ